MVVVTRSKFGEVPSVFDELDEEKRLREIARREAEDETEVPEPDRPDVVASLKDFSDRIPEPLIGRPPGIEDFPYQEEPFYSAEIADAEEVVYMKSTQVGASTAHWRWAAWRVDQFGETVLYFFPTDTHVTEFHDERIRPAIDESAYLRGRIGAVDTKHQKKLGRGTLYFRGLVSKAGAQSVAAQAIVFDEYDESDPGNIRQAERRISGAAQIGMKARVRRMGRPTLPGYGIAAQWESSDKRLWMVTCPECDHEQELTFAENLRWRTEAAGKKVLQVGTDEYEQERDVSEVWRVCSQCETSFEAKPGKRGPIHDGRWVATASGPGRIPGFHITRFIVPKTDLRQIVVSSRQTKAHEIETFHNADLGLPYAAEDAALTDFDLDRVIPLGYAPQDHYENRFPVTMGVDTAGERDLNVRITEHGPDGLEKALLLTTVGDDPGTQGRKAFDKLDDLMVRFRVTMAAVDAGPERRNVRAFANRFPGRVFLVEYETKPTADAIVVDPEDRKARVQRTEAIDAMMDGVRHGVRIPTNPPPPKYREQMKSPKRRTEFDSKDRPFRRYVSTSSQGDDYAHAEVYDLVAKELMTILEVAQIQAERARDHPLDDPDIRPQRRGLYDYDPGLEGGGSY